MDFAETEQWVYRNFWKSGFISFKKYPKRKKIFDVICFFDEHRQMSIDYEATLPRIKKTIKILGGNHLNYLNWFKIDLIDNVVPKLSGIGELKTSCNLEFLLDLILNDVADQNGDTSICLFDHKKEWILKITNDQEEHRIYAKVFCTQFLFEKLELNLDPIY